MDAHLDAARQSRGGALVVVGEAGIGKTALLDHARGRAAGMVILGARGVEAEAELPFAGLGAVLEPLLEGLDRLPPPQRDALAGALGLAPPSPNGRFATYAGALALLADAAERQTLAVLVDDAHWLDRASAEALVFCSRRVEGERVTFLFAIREGERSPFDAPGMPSLRLAGLEPAAAAELVRREAETRVASAVMTRLHEATGGNPLALRELARSLTPAQLAGSEPLPAVLPVGADLERALGGRLARLPEDTRAALLIAAASDSGAVDEITGALRRRSLTLSALAPAEIGDVVSMAGGAVEFTHPLLRSAAYVGATPPVRRDAHAALAASLPPDADRVRRAWHLALATVEPDEATAAEVEAAAREARDRGAPAAAGQAFAAAARLTPRGKERVRRLIESATEYHLAGLPEAARRLLDDALDGAQDPIMRADVQRLRARVLTTGQSLAATRDLLVSEATRVQPHDTVRAAAMLLDVSLTMVVLGDVRESARLAEQAFRPVHERGGTDALIAAFVLGDARILAGDAPAGYPLLREARPLVDSQEVSLFGYIGAMIALAHSWLEHYEESRRMFAAIIARARAQSALMTLPLALAWLADVDQRLGNWTAALAEASESVRLGEEIGRPGELLNGLAALGSLQARRGQAAEGRVTLARADELAASIEANLMRPSAQSALGLLELGQGRLPEAIEALEAAGHAALRGGVEEPGILPWAQDLAEAYARDGSLADAESTLEVLERQAERTGRRLAHAAAARCRGLLAGDDAFEGHFRRALEWHEGVANPFERARTELCFGERLRRARRRRESREWLHSALDVFDRLGAAPWAEHARRELAASGERARRRTPDTADDLTPKELQVAMIVAEGATNREAAAALFVTPKTVETHLNSIYRKLGVRSRVELARRLE